MRKPTDLIKAYEPWRRRLAGESDVPYHMDEPQPGFYRTRLQRGGPFVPVAIWIHQVIDKASGELAEPEVFKCLVGGKPRPVLDVCNYCTRNPISEQEYRRALAEKPQSERKEPKPPAAAKRSALDKMPPLF